MSEIDTIVQQEVADAFDPGLIKASTIRKVYDYWLGKCGDAPMPMAEDIDILDLDFAVGAVSFIDVVDKSPRFQLRMVGSEVVSHHGVDNTGLNVDEIKDEASRGMLLSSYTRVFEQGEPFWIERKTWSENHLFVYECLILPLRNKAGEVVQLMSVLHWPETSSHLPWAKPE